MAYVFISGIPASGKSHIAQEISKEILKIIYFQPRNFIFKISIAFGNSGLSASCRASQNNYFLVHRAIIANITRNEQLNFLQSIDLMALKYHKLLNSHLLLVAPSRQLHPGSFFHLYKTFCLSFCFLAISVLQY